MRPEAGIDGGTGPLAGVAAVLERAGGLSPPAGGAAALGEVVRRAALDLGLALQPFLARLQAGDAAAVEALVERAVVGETFFYRHPDQLRLLTRLMAEAPPARPISAWSAGCATGEEAWTLAMALHDAGRRGGIDRVLGTDVSGRSLEVARAGRYRAWSLRELPASARSIHFTGSGGEVEVLEARRGQVRFARHDLRGPPPGGPFDLVACRNVLPYLRPAAARAALDHLVASLRPGGWLALGPLEDPLVDGRGLERLERAGATVWRRPGGAPPGGRKEAAP
jgi:chemotaxis protein methyltransferase CheR